MSEWARSSRRLGFQGASRKAASLSGHRAIIDALKAADGPAAEQAMRDHIGGIQELIAPVVPHNDGARSQSGSAGAK